MSLGVIIEENIINDQKPSITSREPEYPNDEEYIFLSHVSTVV